MNEAKAVAEFREASAALRRACGVRDDARVAQILANTRMTEASLNLNDAQARLEAADAALIAARAEAPAPADIDVTRQPPADASRQPIRFVADETLSFDELVSDPA